VLRVIAFASGVVAGIALLFFLVAGVSRSEARTLHEQQGAMSVDQARPLESDCPWLSGDDAAEDDSQLDLQGNEVTSAVARYRFDAQGNIYETHAPQTEVPHLGSPQS
jgi:hypothetical protein